MIFHPCLISWVFNIFIISVDIFFSCYYFFYIFFNIFLATLTICYVIIIFTIFMLYTAFIDFRFKIFSKAIITAYFASTWKCLKNLSYFSFSAKWALSVSLKIVIDTNHGQNFGHFPFLAYLCNPKSVIHYLK